MELKGHLLYYPEGKHDINLNNYVLKNQLNDALKSKVDSITKTTYADLKNLRDNSQLTPGSLYRITDYNCTTTQENTRSAGHQFDIVLLALSEDKLAEEGWAMVHDTPIYDVIFTDDNIKCYLNKIDENVYNVVSVETLLGIEIPVDILEPLINEESKTIDITTLGYGTIDLYEGITYNYFQNSNLSAWKVWYSLDNDKSRFAWADDSKNGDYIFDGGAKYERKVSEDVEGYYAWYDEDGAETLFTQNPNPKVGDNLYYDDGGEWAISSQITKIAGNGRGVIYRLIDEWNNDVAYDFKNIQFVRPMTGGEYDPDNGTDTWVYTFTDTEEGEITDATAKSVDLFMNSFIERYCSGHKLSNNAVLTMGNGSNWIRVEAESKNNTFYNDPNNIRLIHSQNMEIDGENGTIYINNKKVLTES